MKRSPRKPAREPQGSAAPPLPAARPPRPNMWFLLTTAVLLLAWFFAMLAMALWG